MVSADYVLQDLESTIKENSKLYQAALQKDLRHALQQYHWEKDTLKVESLRSASPKDSLNDSFFPIRDDYLSLQAGYIFPFRKIAIADLSPFVETLASVLSPQGYEVRKYSHHRGLPDVWYLIDLLRQNNSRHFQVEIISAQLHA